MVWYEVENRNYSKTCLEKQELSTDANATLQKVQNNTAQGDRVEGIL